MKNRTRFSSHEQDPSPPRRQATSPPQFEVWWSKVGRRRERDAVIFISLFWLWKTKNNSFHRSYLACDGWKTTRHWWRRRNIQWLSPGWWKSAHVMHSGNSGDKHTFPKGRHFLTNTRTFPVGEQGCFLLHELILYWTLITHQNRVSYLMKLVETSCCSPETSGKKWSICSCSLRGKGKSRCKNTEQRY